MNLEKNILITTGDVDGIGLEVTVNSLLSLKKIPRGYRVIFFRTDTPDAFAKRTLARLRKQFKTITFSSLKEALAHKEKLSSQVLFEIISTKSPAIWVEESAKACFSKEAFAMVTAPLSKQEVISAGLKDLGHTDILKRVSGVKNAFMGFIGKHFNVVLATGHLPVAAVESALTVDLYSQATNAAIQLQGLLKHSKKPIAAVGMNPHASDGGLIGSFEKDTLIPTLKNLQNKGVKIQGPLVPDACFHSENWSKYALYLCCYHDQGLIPFKMAHGHDSGVHVTLGLPIRRTSVDHGTAKDIYGKNKAKHHSMKEALLLAFNLK